MVIKKIQIKTVIKPLKVVFSTSLGKKSAMKSVIVKVILEDGIYGLGECPTSFVSKVESVENIKKILKHAGTLLLNQPIDTYEEKIFILRNTYPDFPMTISGLEVALFRASLKYRGIDEHSHWGAKKHLLETDITIPFLLDRTILKGWLRFAIKKGFKIFKLKVSGDIEQDSFLLRVVDEILKDSMETFILRLDGNQGFTEKTFLIFHGILEKNGYNVECFEQPLEKNNFNGMKNIKKYSKFPLILDETVFNERDLDFVISENICDGINIKISKSGISESKKMIKKAKENNIKLMIGCMTETMVGLSAGIYMASGTDIFDCIDLDSIFFMKHKSHYEDIQINPPFFIIENHDFSFLTKLKMNATH